MSIKQITRPEGEAGRNYRSVEQSELYDGLDAAEMEALDRIANPVNLEAHSSLLRQHTPAKHVYNVLSGSLLVDRVASSGRRQVLAFLFPGDFLGLPHNDYYEFSVQSLTECTLAAFHRKEFGELNDGSPTLKHNLDRISSNVLARALDQVFALGQKKAHERVCFLLNQLLQRQPGATPHNLVLPMTRRDIADYLGLTIETVSRAFAKLIDEGIISVENIYELSISDLPRLQEMAASN